MKRWMAILCAAVLLGCALFPGASYTEDQETVLLARMIYALGRGESYDAKLALGTVAMNRVENAWFPDSLEGVLNEQHQFPIGSRYDAESLSAAHDVLSGVRALSADALYYESACATDPRHTEKPLRTVGGFRFFR